MTKRAPYNSPRCLSRERVAGIAGLLFSVLFVLTHARPALAADAYLFLGPTEESYQVDRQFSVAVKVNSGESAINAAEATLVFDPQILEVISVSKTGSIFGLWTTDPEFSNTKGTVTFGGGSAARFNGDAGLVLIVTFRGKSPGSATVSFSSGAILAADGKGTNIIARMDGSRYTILPLSSIPIERGGVPGGPGSPEVISTTHPNSDQWYSDPNPNFVWNLPPGVTDARVGIDNQPEGLPRSILSPAPTSYSASPLSDGVWYFHIQFRNNVGWGRIEHFPLHIDTQKPDSFSIELADRSDETDPRVRLRFSADDKTSGIARYEVEIDNRDPDIWQPRIGMLYESDALEPGQHLILARAVDAAGNSLVESRRITVAPIGSPRIISYPQQLRAQDSFELRGISAPGTTIRLFFSRDDGKLETRDVTTETSGVFTFISKDRLQEGVYTVTLQAIDQRGAQSEKTAPITFSVEPTGLIRFGRQLVEILSVIIPLGILLAGLGFGIWKIWQKFFRVRALVHREITETEKLFTDYIAIIHKDIQEQLARVEAAGLSRELTKEERHFLRQFQHYVEEEGAVLTQKMKKIEHDVE